MAIGPRVVCSKVTARFKIAFSSFRSKFASPVLKNVPVEENCDHFHKFANGSEEWPRALRCHCNQSRKRSILYGVIVKTSSIVPWACRVVLEVDKAAYYP